MTPDQFAQLMDLLEKMVSKQYTLTGAADWEILVILGGMLAAAIAAMWVDLKGTIKDNRGELRDELMKHMVNDERDHEKIWMAMKDCQSDCCPREKK